MSYQCHWNDVHCSLSKLCTVLAIYVSSHKSVNILPVNSSLT